MLYLSNAPLRFSQVCVRESLRERIVAEILVLCSVSTNLQISQKSTFKKLLYSFKNHCTIYNYRGEPIC